MPLDKDFSQLIRCNPRGSSGIFFDIMNSKEGLNNCFWGCSIGSVKDKEKGDYYIGCLDCGGPVKINSSGEIEPKIRKKATPAC